MPFCSFNYVSVGRICRYMLHVTVTCEMWNVRSISIENVYLMLTAAICQTHTIVRTCGCPMPSAYAYLIIEIGNVSVSACIESALYVVFAVCVLSLVVSKKVSFSVEWRMECAIVTERKI